ncbi:VirB6/TrbL-like conjugal transfer protein, CD1112 family [[Clostridium] scindens]|uniref:VirB6/TrbL-like conjugal transfer protein, CD1112 family n=1 Tax=Clostridium scindens (strain JCM 10418 / VPI 12708) TaxID=29347 RepID=UPI0022E5FA16|nr:CD0415/CD1112 family protein [[Clostridium] scindens]
MQSILDKLAEWLKELLIDGITGNLSGMFDTVNTKVGEIAGEVGMTPSAWNGGVFNLIRNLIRNLSETVIIPIAGIILTFVMCYELIQLVVEKNNLHDIDTWMFFKWIFKTFVAVLLVTNTWNIVMAIFDVAQSVVNQSGGLISSTTDIDLATAIPDMEAQLEAMDLGPLLGLWFQSMVVGLTMNILSICIFLVVYGRMIEIYLVTSIGPISFATMSNREWSGVGQNYLKSLIALGFQAFLIMICVGIYAVLIQEISTSDNLSAAIWGCMGYTVLLCFTLFKTGSMAKSLFGTH